MLNLLKRIPKILLRHCYVTITAAILCAGFALAVFLYNNFYQPLLDMVDIYTLKGELNAVVIDTQRLDNAHALLEAKISPVDIPLSAIVSPF